jgi:hypothetical protein
MANVELILVASFVLSPIQVFFHVLCFSSIASILSGIIGIHYGHVLIHFKVIIQNIVLVPLTYDKCNFEISF